jgi:hypothetical protein
LEKIKNHISEWLSSELKATLSSEKTLITDMTKEAAYFLRFELLATHSRKLEKKKHKDYSINLHKDYSIYTKIIQSIYTKIIQSIYLEKRLQEYVASCQKQQEQTLSAYQIVKD